MNRFKMLARDNNSSPTQYRTWVVPGQPDFTGDMYTGLKSGNTPFDDVTTTIVLDGYAVVDFNLPDPLSWDTTERVLPEATYDSQLAVIDGYVYLFGGAGSKKIFRATLDNPADWVDTGATLPNILSRSQLAIIDTTVYLFGGNDGYGPTDHVYSAALSDPLTWTDLGVVLPKKLQDSQLVIIDGYVYLLGGQDIDGPTNSVLRADATIPLVWTNIGGLLPDPLYGSQVGFIGNSIYLFGGFNNPESPTSNIYSASISNLFVWSVVGALPVPSFNGQFFTIGSRGYLITPTDSTLSFSRILRCNLSNPASWIDTFRTVPGLVNSSQFAIIYDRVFLFGGNGSSVIFANEQILKYIFTSPEAISYGDVTRTQVDATIDRLDLFSILGFPYWKTDYVF